MSVTLESNVVDIFRNITSSPEEPDVRSILIQSEPAVRKLDLVTTLPPSASDKDDFEDHLSKLFSNEPSRSGYALYRLDSQAANGDWEWLCIAYQPDGAKVKEKMQYTATRAALLAGLNEHHFLETIYASGNRDFVFPAKLRNSRKHDYQNPQLKTAGKPASEAAGTDAGGARRNFGNRGTASGEATSAAFTGEESASSVKDGQPHARVDEASSNPDSQVDLPAKSTFAGSSASEEEKHTVHEVSTSAVGTGAPLEAVAEAAIDGGGATTSPSAGAAQPATVSSFAPSSAGVGLPPSSSNDAAAAREAADQEVGQRATASSTEASQAAAAQDQAFAETQAPEEPPTRADQEQMKLQQHPPSRKLADEFSDPTVPDAETIKGHLDASSAPVTKPLPETTPYAPQRATASSTATASLTTPAPSSESRQAASGGSSATGAASSASGAGQSSSSSSAPPHPATTLMWDDDAEAAVSGLAERASGTAEHNFVPLRANQAESSVSLASTPRFVPPGDLQTTMRSEVSNQGQGISFVLYRYPAEVEAASRQAIFIHADAKSAVSSSSTFFANALDVIQERIEDLTGLDTSRELDQGRSYGPYPRPSEAQERKVSERVASIQYQIRDACEASSADARLVAVSKLHPPSSIMAAHLCCGQTHFGENYAQELVDKAKVLPKEIQWHFVGALQSNKAKSLAAIPNLWCLETLDSIKLADALEKALAKERGDDAETLRVFVQVNTSGEEAKSGVAPLTGDAGGSQELVELAKHVVVSCPHLTLQGLMTIGSAANSKAAGGEGKDSINKQQALELNPDFHTLHKSRANLVAALRGAVEGLSDKDAERYSHLLDSQGDELGGLELSMGMTSDFAVAIAAGSTNVRIGTACFGERPGSRDEARRNMEGELSHGGSGGGGGGKAAAQTPVGNDGSGFAKPKRPGGKR
ncbi:unnamed protein product [Jaminaea pallidilutea]